jgi:hypothetical protein
MCGEVAAVNERSAVESLDGVDLCDLDRFARGFPHELFELLRRERPVWFHPATPLQHLPALELGARSAL